MYLAAVAAIVSFPLLAGALILNFQGAGLIFELFLVLLLEWE